MWTQPVGRAGRQNEWVWSGPVESTVSMVLVLNKVKSSDAVGVTVMHLIDWCCCSAAAEWVSLVAG